MDQTLLNYVKESGTLQEDILLILYLIKMYAYTLESQKYLNLSCLFNNCLCCYFLL
jgi:hypothetical protein